MGTPKILKIVNQVFLRWPKTASRAENSKKTWFQKGTSFGTRFGMVFGWILSSKWRFFGGRGKRPGITIVVFSAFTSFPSWRSYQARSGAQFWFQNGPHFGAKNRANFSKGRPRGILEPPKMAQKAKRKGSKNGSQKRSAKNQVNRKNRPAASLKGMGPEAMGRDIGRGKPFP